MQWALIKNGVVENIIEWEWDGSEDTDLFKDYVKVDVTNIQCRIGWEWDGVSFSNPNATPGPTNIDLYKSELRILNAQYNADISALASAWGAPDFSTEQMRRPKTQLQNAAINRQSQNVADIAALKLKYGV
ncbi:hypothetical protein [Enterobacter roggenkampii]|uniref:hypothetical protein n=1 Tax=Enterobacter roggenkampii TaxID=1812935 RepID=UPI00107E8C8E|nr:hypothetical protein [Enterobacter roggenkampii]QBX83360.1 hypothetical protein E4005_00145 [Enterobacter roggenkampii]